jgi:broad specificity phosphatase PhoE
MGCDISSENNGKKILICTRHGERSDYAGMTPTLGKNDAELTNKGMEQAYNIGVVLCDEILKREIKGKIKILSSPFARTLQTAKYISKALSERLTKAQHDNTINVQNFLCEYIEYSLISKDLPKNYLAVYNNKNFRETEFQKTKLKFVNDKENLPHKIETEEDCIERIKNMIDITLESCLENEIDVVILVSHGTPIDKINQHLGYPGPYGYKQIEYCDSFIYGVDLNTKKFQYICRRKCKM